MLLTVSEKVSSFGGLSSIGSTGFDQKALINLTICKNSELMAGSQYPETPPDSEIRVNNDLIFFRKAGHAGPTPFLLLGIRVVMIESAQSLQLGMVIVKFSPILISITQFPFNAFLHEFSCCSL